MPAAPAIVRAGRAPEAPEERQPWWDQPITRRLLVVATLLQGVSAVQQLLQGRGSLVTRALEVAARRHAERSPFDTERARLLAALVRPGPRVHLWPGTEHAYGRPTDVARRLGYPHDLEAIAGFRNLFAGAVDVVEREHIPSLLAAGDVVIGTGNATSSRLARSLAASLPFQHSVDLPYELREDFGEERFVRVISGMEGSAETLKRGKCLVDRRTGEVLYDDRDHLGPGGWLRRDVLLVSRLPVPRLGCSVLLLSGGHGVGTQAAELLFRPDLVPLAGLRELAAALAGEEHFQLVLEVEAIEHRAPMSVSHAIALSRRAPPRPVGLQASRPFSESV